MKVFLGLVLLSLSSVLWAEPLAHRMVDSSTPRLVLLMDDLGYVKKLGDRALALQGQITYAVLPFTPYANHFAAKVVASKRELMAHVPMENSNDKALGPGALTASMTKSEIQAMVHKVLDSMPQVAGMNNHMGSVLTQNKQSMQWVMEVLAARDLYFVDSVTTVKTQGWREAKALELPYLKRHVFIDHVASEPAIERQLNRAIALAKRNGFAVAIAHPYKETLTVLEKVLPTLAEQGVALAPASEISQPLVKARLANYAKQKALDIAKHGQTIPNKLHTHTDG
ncbi:MAG: divergent polysaccharide deacetylase family protein [Pontibacterium sp.]